MLQRFPVLLPLITSFVGFLRPPFHWVVWESFKHSCISGHKPSFYILYLMLHYLWRWYILSSFHCSVCIPTCLHFSYLDSQGLSYEPTQTHCGWGSLKKPKEMVLIKTARPQLDQYCPKGRNLTSICRLAYVSHVKCSKHRHPCQLHKKQRLTPRLHPQAQTYEKNRKVKQKVVIIYIPNMIVMIGWKSLMLILIKLFVGIYVENIIVIM